MANFTNWWKSVATNKEVGGLFPNDGDGNAWGDKELGFPKPLSQLGFTLLDPGRFGDGGRKVDRPGRLVLQQAVGGQHVAEQGRVAAGSVRMGALGGLAIGGPQLALVGPRRDAEDGAGGLEAERGGGAGDHAADPAATWSTRG